MCLELLYPIPFEESSLTLTHEGSERGSLIMSNPALALSSALWPRLSGRVTSQGLALIGVVALHLWLRWPALHNPHFHNEDTAGITYSAELILRGGVPLRDTVEMKAPGAFFILAGWWSALGRSVMSAQLLMLLWSGLAALGVGVGAWWLTRAWWVAWVTGLAYVAFAPYTDSIDINYGAWMITPYVWSAALLIKKAQRSEGLGAWALAGLLMTIAALCKRQGAALAPLFVLAVWPTYTRAGSQRAMSALGVAVAGCALGFVPIVSWYASQGALGEWLSSYALSRSGWEYVQGGGEGGLSGAERWLRIGDGVMGLWEYSRAPLCLALCGSGLLLSSRALPTTQEGPPPPRLGLLWALSGLSFIGASLGWRYFKGYYLQLLPALLWLMASALARLSALRTLRGSKRVLIVLVSLSLLAPITRDIQQSYTARVRRARPLYLPTYETRRVADWIKARAQQGDTLWVWGRWGWPLYHQTGLMSPTRYFKTLGVLTTQLTNTWNPSRRSEPVRFNPQSAWREAIEELRVSPPRFIVLSRNEGWGDFTALKELLSERYKRIPTASLRLHRPGQETFTVYQRR